MAKARALVTPAMLNIGIVGTAADPATWRANGARCCSARA